MSNIYNILKKLVSHTFNPELRNEVWRWLITPSRTQEKEEALYSLWNEYPTGADTDARQAYEETCKRIGYDRHRNKFSLFGKKLARIAAILIIPLLSITGSLYYVHKYSTGTEWVQCVVPDGEKEEFILPDGSKVNINSGSMLIYPEKFRGPTRSVFLLGEANFTVKKNEDYPFIVKTSYLKIKALGTKFNVQAYSENDKIITTLEQGAIKIDKIIEDENSFILSPNEQLEYNYRTGEFAKRVIQAANYSGWAKGELNLINMSLKDMLTTIEREYAVHFIIPPQLLKPDLYTIKFPQQESIDKIMKILTLTVGGISYDIKDNIISIYPLKKKGRT